MKSVWEKDRGWDDFLYRFIIVIVCSATFIVIVCSATLGVLFYKDATDPCRCVEKKCFTVTAATLIGKTIVPTTQVQCECLKKVCPAEKP